MSLSVPVVTGPQPLRHSHKIKVVCDPNLYLLTCFPMFGLTASLHFKTGLRDPSALEGIWMWEIKRKKKNALLEWQDLLLILNEIKNDLQSLTTYGHHCQKSSGPEGEGSWSRPLWLSLPLTWVRLGGISLTKLVALLTNRIRSVYIPSSSHLLNTDMNVKPFVMLWLQPPADKPNLEPEFVVCQLCDFRQVSSPS